ncbi:MAG: MoaD/ThiS family protein [Phycisphaerales bacterium]|nr:MoaD/ThiS family protein [Phycisphaerales bacterium]
MPKVRFTHHLQRYFPGLESTHIENAPTAAHVVARLNETHPGLADYVLDERGSLRKHVNIFIRGRMITDRTTLSDPVAPDDEVCIMQALSGG